MHPTKKKLLHIIAIFLIYALPIQTQGLEPEPENNINTINEKQSQPRIGKIEAGIAFFDSPVHRVFWCDDNYKDYLIALTIQGIVYKSSDHGFNWISLKKSLQKSMEFENINSDGNVLNIIQSPIDKNLLLLQGTEGSSWITTDCGELVSVIHHGSNLMKFQYHPTQRTWILGLSRNICRDSYSKNCTNKSELIVTLDLGDTWKTLADEVSDFSWGLVPNNADLNFPERRILVQKKNSSQKDLISLDRTSWNHHLSVYMSDDFFHTTEELIKHGNRFALTKYYLFIATATDLATQEVSLYVSSTFSKNYHFVKATLPFSLQREHSYTILDTLQHQVFLHVTHSLADISYGHIYISNSIGNHFTLSQKYNIKNDKNFCDFERIKGMEGIYMINRYEKKSLDRGRIELSRKSDTSMDNYRISSKLDNLLKKKSLITFNKGSSWGLIKPPLFDIDKSEIDCKPPCSLHLHSLSSPFAGPILSAESAPGVIQATGNVGEYLDKSNISTFLSRDGGVHWYKIGNGSHIYEIGDQGGLILMAEDQQASKFIYLTWNQGQTWKKIKISDEDLLITNIVQERDNVGLKFQVYGISKQQGKYGFMVPLNFEKLLPRNCDHWEDPDKSDYEIWIPTSQDNKCLMGKKISYLRRKPNSECFNPDGLNLVNRPEICECTMEDYECDVEFVKNKYNECVLPNHKEIDFSPPETCNQTYNVKKGYRKIAGNVCENGVYHHDYTLPCPAESRKIYFMIGQVVIILIFLVMVIKFDLCTKFFRLGFLF